MHIALVNTLYPTDRFPEIVGGAEKSVQTLARQLAANGVEVSVIRTHPPELPQFAEKDGLVKVFSFPTQNHYWLFDRERHTAVQRISRHIADDRQRLARSIAFTLSNLKPDILHTNTISGIGWDLWRLAKKIGAPILHTLRDYNLECAKMTRFSADKRCLSRCAACKLVTRNRRKLTHLVDGVVGISEYVLNHHLQAGLFPNARVRRVIYNSVAPMGRSARRPGGEVRFGYLGRISPEKGIDLLLNASKHVELSGRIHIAGSISDDGLATSISTAGSRIQYYGQVDPSDFLSQIDVLVVPSIWEEPFGRSIVEANIMGVPVIGSSRGGIPELIRPGVSGWLFDPDNPQELVEIMVKLSRNPEQIAFAAENTWPAAEQYSSKFIAERYTAQYQSLLSPSSGGAA